MILGLSMTEQIYRDIDPEEMRSLRSLSCEDWSEFEDIVGNRYPPYGVRSRHPRERHVCHCGRNPMSLDEMVDEFYGMNLFL